MWWCHFRIDLIHFSVMSSLILKLPFTCDDYHLCGSLCEHACVQAYSHEHVDIWNCLTVRTKVKLNCLCVLWSLSESTLQPSSIACPKPSLAFNSLVLGEGFQCLFIFPDPGTAWNGMYWVLFLLQNSQAHSSLFYVLFHRLLHSPPSLDLLTPWVCIKKRDPWAPSGVKHSICLKSCQINSRELDSLFFPQGHGIRGSYLLCCSILPQLAHLSAVTPCACKSSESR